MALSVLLLLLQSIRAQETFGTVVGAVAAVAAKLAKFLTAQTVRPTVLVVKVC